MTSPTFSIPQALEALPETCPGVRAWVVAYSGGVDSTVLLHGMRAFAAQRGDELRAVHVNHGLQPAAEDFERHCAKVCREWDIPLERMHREGEPEPGLGPEAQAREIRYRALQPHARADTAVLLAHNRDDQAETLLLQLLRGSGVAGTAAMPPCRDWGEGKLVRPLLDVPRGEIEDYARAHRLEFVEDPSNLDLEIERNFLRHEMLPLLEARWPSVSRTLARSARHHAHAARLLHERAEEDLGAEDTIPVEFLASLSDDRQVNLVRFWIARQGFAVPGERRLRQWLHTVHAAGADRVPGDVFEGYRMYRWRGRLHLVPQLPALPEEACWRWRRGEALALPELEMDLRWESLQEQLGEEVGTDLEVRLRTGGERCRPEGRQHRHALKKLLQEAGVPPWRRGRIPLVYQHAKLRLVWGHFACRP
ncbi:MAG: tRNA lysidine(34) synthetase TilS [Gammaproteobacteria bacterium]|nr:tRNA lysidine(34) synthetase TilS [Gammaproteobacteria bacterium]